MIRSTVPTVASVLKFDIFAGTRDNDARWIEAVEGLANANKRMQELAAQNPGKYFIFYTGTHTVVANIETFAEQEKSPRSDSGAA
jgi:hypothetical protein